MVLPRNNVVVVNDDPTQRVILSGLLEKEGHRVQTFVDAETALAAMTSAPPDLIITDIYMPGMDGWRFCRLLRSPEYAAFNRLPILVISATFAGEEADRITTNLGANAFLSAPVHGRRFLECVRRLLKGEIPQASPHVLIVDESRNFCTMLRGVFEEHGYVVEEAGDGQTALKRIREDCPAVLVFNYHLPDMEGEDLLTELQTIEPRPVIVTMTPDPDPNLPLLAMKLGARAYVRMPFDPEYLINVCNNVRRERSLLQIESLLEKRTQELQESERQYRTIFENSVLGIFRTTPEGRYVTANPALARILGYESPEEIISTIKDIGRQVFADPKERDRLIRLLGEEGVIEGYEAELRRKDGNHIWTSFNVRVVQTRDGVFHEGIVENITERRRIEEERLKLSKLESTGILAGGIAHDFNNLLATMVGNIELARTYITSSGELADHLDAAEQMAWAARDLTQQLITFSKGGAPVVRPFTLPDMIREQASLVLLGSSVGSLFSMPFDLWRAVADESQIKQVIRNIVLNAREAMPGGGTVLVTAENLTLKETPEISLPAGDYVKIGIADQGPGIPKEKLSRIFDPYFSTKQRGTQKGMGLGLTICHSIIQKHSGTITVSSETGKGSVFDIYLPACRQTVHDERIAGGLASQPVRILVMDDDETVRNLFGTALRLSGYNVETVNDGETAVESYRSAKGQGKSFGAVILNLTVRGHMGGQEALQEMQAIEPGIKAIVTSGYGEDPVMKHFAAYGFKGALVKPYRIVELRDMLARVLGNTKSSIP